jgi:hypothetical protein
MKLPGEGDNVAMAENLRNIELNAKETERVSREIERAKREGNVAEEERLKVQMTRLSDERVKLDATRREIEREESRSILPMTPEFSSSTPTSAGGEEDDASRVRGAVASFNAKMLDKYGDDYENIPESSPRTPSSPAYSSIFEGGAQRGGSGSGNRKFIPQIPASIVDSYLNSRYGMSSSATSVANTVPNAASATTMFGGGGMSIPTMNIPVVATMPMAGMMPIQQQQQAIQLGGGAQQQQQPQQQQQQQQGATQSGGNNANEPNAQGVRTFSIKL